MSDDFYRNLWNWEMERCDRANYMIGCLQGHLTIELGQSRADEIIKIAEKTVADLMVLRTAEVKAEDEFKESEAQAEARLMGGSIMTPYLREKGEV